jgi:predicted MFS family arabinose efflux permease
MQPHTAMEPISPVRKWLLVFFFSLAQFIDVCNISELFSAIPTIVVALGMTESQSVWLVSGYQLTFASFLLMVSLKQNQIFNT